MRWVMVVCECGGVSGPQPLLLKPFNFGGPHILHDGGPGIGKRDSKLGTWEMREIKRHMLPVLCRDVGRDQHWRHSWDGRPRRSLGGLLAPAAPQAPAAFKLVT